MGLGLAGWLVTDGLLRLSHLPLSPGITLAGLALGAWWWRRPRPLGPSATDVPGWLERLERLEAQFGKLAGAQVDASSPAGAVLEAARLERANQLACLRQELGRAGLTLALVGTNPPSGELQGTLLEALRGPEPIQLHWAHPLPPWSADWCWPPVFEACDGLIHHLRMPLSAAELRWLEALPQGQPAWLLVHHNGEGPGPDQLAAELQAQLGAELSARLLFWDGQPQTLASSLAPLARDLGPAAASLRQARQLRRLQQLHGRWQRDLEQQRRELFRPLQRRTQWIVAAGVVAAPLPSLDLLVLAVANGLMLQEMARLWDCPWTLEQLQAAAAELAKASLALGVVEWSSQALAGLVKWHGATWLVGGAMQALSAAYLTRVVAHAMADMLALSAGVSEPDLAAIKRQAPLLVAQAAEAEKLDWSAFLEQGRQWLRSQPVPAADGGSTACEHAF
ncbi:YcjF family protein [Cyanobium sp. FACHB-13342]|nr:YcjF family protein [Cyanobium sp. FACHB-13342]